MNKRNHLLMFALAIFILPLHLLADEDSNNSLEIEEMLNGLNNWPSPESTDSEKVIQHVMVAPLGKPEQLYKIEYSTESVPYESELIRWKGASKQTVWPGAIYSGKSVLSGSPSLVRAKRTPITLTINVPLASGSPNVTVENPSVSTVSDAINSAFLNSLSPENVVSKIEHRVVKTSSLSEAYFSMGASATFPIDAIAVGASGSFKHDRENQTATLSGYFEQVLFKINFDDDEIMANADFFSKDTGAPQLKAAFGGDDLSPAFVSEVHYGRRIAFVITSSKDVLADELTAAINASVPDVGGGKADVTARQKKVLESSSITFDSTGPFKSKQYEQLIKGGQISTLFEDIDPKTAVPLAFRLSYLNSSSRDPAVIVSQYLRHPEDVMKFAEEPVGHVLTFHLDSVRPTAGACHVPHWMYSSAYEYKDWSRTHTGEQNIFNKSVTLSPDKSHRIGTLKASRWSKPSDPNKPHAVLLYSGYWDRGMGKVATTLVFPPLGEIGLALGRYKDQEWFAYPFPKLPYGIKHFKQNTTKFNCPAEWSYRIFKQARYQDRSVAP